MLDDDLAQAAGIGNQPRLRAIGQIAITENHHRGHVLHGDGGGLDGRLEAIGGGAGGDHGHGAFTMPPQDCLEEIGLFGLGGQPGTGAAALDVHDDDGQFGHNGQAHGFGFQRYARAAGGGSGDGAAERSADRSAHGRDLILGLEGDHTHVLLAGEFVEDVGGGGDRVRAQEHRLMDATGDEPVGEGEVAGDVAVVARRAFAGSIS